MFRLLYNNINEILLKKNIKSEVNFFEKTADLMYSYFIG